MSRTFFHKTKRADGSEITVEFGVEGSSSPTTYSPHSGASGGDAPEYSVIKAFSEETGADITLDDAERERIEAEICETFVDDDDGSDDDR